MSTRTKRPASKKAAPAPKAAAKAPKATPRAAAETVGLEEIKGLIALVARESFAEFEFEAGEMRFRIRKGGEVTMVAPAPAPVVLGSPVAHVAAQSVAAPAPAPAPRIQSGGEPERKTTERARM
ncbi:MAG TPA: hypothetical protein VFM16_07455, partial [Holophagaceae bacterium]|nr:hypothetical protein [Holophagaceae bacterium]